MLKLMTLSVLVVGAALLAAPTSAGVIVTSPGPGTRGDSRSCS